LAPELLFLLHRSPWRTEQNRGVLARQFSARRVASGEVQVGEKGEELKSYLWVAVARRERVGGGGSA